MIRTPDIRTAPAPVETPDTAPVEVRPKTPQEVGEHAARYIEEHGWTQREAWINEDGSACAYGAVMAVTGAGTSYFGMHGQAAKLAREAERRFCEHLGIESVEDWNDAPERTEAEVLAALRSIR